MTTAARIAFSLVDMAFDGWALTDGVAGAAAFLSAIRLTGMRVGDVISPTVPWAKANPVIAPQVLRLTSAVACCQVGFLPGCTKSPSFTLRFWLAGCVRGSGFRSRSFSSRWAGS